MFEEDIPKYKKKSHARGLARSKHKHTYETVLLRSNYETVDIKTGKPCTRTYTTPTKVCTICGRIDYVDDDPSYYVTNNTQITKMFTLSSRGLSDKALKLPKWECDIFEKFAVKMETKND